MGVLSCCVFFVKCRQRKPQKLGAEAPGPSESGGFAADCWRTHSLSMVMALCGLLCAALTGPCGVGEDAFETTRATVCERGLGVSALLVEHLEHQ